MQTKPLRFPRQVSLSTENGGPNLANKRDTVWLSIRHAADRVDSCPRMIKRWIAEGYLPATRLPSPSGKGHLRIRLGDLEALMARGTLQ